MKRKSATMLVVAVGEGKKKIESYLSEEATKFLTTNELAQQHILF